MINSQEFSFSLEVIVKKIFITIFCSLLAITVVQIGTLNAYGKKSYLHKAKSYTPKALYSGLGKKSSVNGRIKAKPVSGYFKPSNGYKFVNSYARS